MVLRRNEKYHGRFTGNLENVEIQFSHFEDTGKLGTYEDNELDVLYSPYHQGGIDWLASRYPGEYIAAPLLTTFSFCFDTTQLHLSDPRVRRAVAMSTDKVGVWKTILSSRVENIIPASGGFVPLGMPGHSPGISLAFNPQEAKKLLADAGYPEGRDFPTIEVAFIYQSEEINRRIERIWSSQWKEILGIESKWEFLDFESFLKRVQTDRPMVGSFSWAADYPDPDNFLRVGLPKFMGWRHEMFEALIERSRKCLDQNERLSMLREADKILMEEAPTIPLFYWGSSYLVKPWVRRYFPSWKDIIIDPH
jgi:oligopeptide transport system substrate-binding protein